MTLAQLLQDLDILSTSGDLDLTVTELTCDSRNVRKGTLFFALRGFRTDGHSFIMQAVNSGATAVVLEDKTFAPAEIPWVQVRNSRQAMACMASCFYGHPTRNLPLVGVTGTNGKTTTSYLLEGILNSAGLPAAVLGTICYRFRDIRIDAGHTTPESTELQAIFRQMVNAGAKSLVIEVSSHALEQRRVDGSVFDVGVFTNLTRDHLDYHGDMGSYSIAKQRLFSELLKPDKETPQRFAIINADDPSAKDFVKTAACPVISYGLTAGADITARQVSLTVDGISAILVTPKGDQSFSSHLLGRFNLSNILAAAAAGIALNLPLSAVIQGIEQHKTVPGRLERVENNQGITCLVDYAHTGDALDNVLCTLKELAEARIITVFGCGGDRDTGKRPIMGRIAASCSDLAIVTSDNPRTESPGTILSQIREGILPLGLREYTLHELASNFADKGFVILENRREAIRLGVRLARPGDILLLAGKGHEDYQIFGQERHHFDDREEAANAFREGN